MSCMAVVVWSQRGGLSTVEKKQPNVNAHISVALVLVELRCICVFWLRYLAANLWHSVPLCTTGIVVKQTCVWMAFRCSGCF